MGWWNEYPKSKPRRPADGIRAKSERGAFGKTWWASRWIAALERLVDTARLGRGRSYARSGQVLDLDVRPGRVDSRVQGSRATPYKVSIRIKPLTDAEWERVADAMAAQAIFAAKLLAGEMPQNIEEAFTAAGVSLFPGQRGDLQTDCSCPDYANPCKHIAAVYYLLGEQFDEDPFLIFQLRGRTKNSIMAALRARRAGGDEAQNGTAATPEEAAVREQAVPLETCLAHFWTAGEGLEELRFSIEPPPVDAAPVKRLGPPPFWQGRQGFLSLMGQAYAAITRTALGVAYGEDGD